MKYFTVKALPLLLILVDVTHAHWSEREPQQSYPVKMRTKGEASHHGRLRVKKKTKSSSSDVQPHLRVSSSGEESIRVDDNSASDRMFVEYFDEEGKDEIVSSASAVIKEYPGQNLMVVELDHETRNTLVSKRVIKSAQHDGRVEGSGIWQDAHTPLRVLEEKIPWGIRMIQADQLDVGDFPVTICIVDTGYALGHPDLPLDVTGDDAISKFGDLWEWQIDFNGHGTHVAGTIAALGNNDVGVLGAGKIPLHITRGLDDNSGGFESDVLDAVDQCVAAGAKIISLSLGGDVMSDRASRKYEEAVNDLGMMVVAASGNQGQKRHAYPASHPAVISVGAVYEWSRFWEGSNYSDQVEFAAPGHGVLSTSTTLSAVHTFDYSFTAEQVGGSRRKERDSILVDCGVGNSVCNTEGIIGGICLMSRDQTSLKSMIANCERAGGVGAIVFDANPNMDKDYHARVDIPVSLVSTSVGIDLLKYVGTKVSLGYHESDEPEHTYKYLQGTSMAVPHVAAAAALVWSHFPDCTNQEIRYALAVTASDQGLSGCDWDYGHGIVQTYDAFRYLQDNACGSGNVGFSGGGCATTTGFAA